MHRKAGFGWRCDCKEMCHSHPKSATFLDSVGLWTTESTPALAVAEKCQSSMCVFHPRFGHLPRSVKLLTRI